MTDSLISSSLVRRMLNEHIIAEQTLLVSECFDKGVLFYDDIENYYHELEDDETGETVETELYIFDWYLISCAFARVLKNCSEEALLITDLGTWWGVSYSYTDLLENPILQDIANEMYAINKKAKND
jgi:hypothetical protein